MHAFISLSDGGVQPLSIMYFANAALPTQLQNQPTDDIIVVPIKNNVSISLPFSPPYASCSSLRVLIAFAGFSSF